MSSEITNRPCPWNGAVAKVKESLSLSERVFRCDCGFEADRDHNAAMNLRSLAVSSTVAACGPASARGSGMKQESNTLQECPCLGQF